MPKKEIVDTSLETDVFSDYVNDMIDHVEKNRADPTKYVRNTIPDDVVPYQFVSEEDEEDGTE